MTTTTTSLLIVLAALPVLWEVDGTVAAPVDAVAALLFAVEDGRVGDDNLLVLGGSSAARRGAMTVASAGAAGRYRAEYAGTLAPVHIEVHGAVAAQSWYGGIHTVLPSPAGARVVHRVHRLLPHHPGFPADLTEPGMHRRLTRDLRRVLAVIADRLGC